MLQLTIKNLSTGVTFDEKYSDEDAARFADRVRSYGGKPNFEVLAPIPALRGGANEEIVCAHRDLSCCPECFAVTPGLVDVFGEVFRFDASDWRSGATDDFFAGLKPGEDPAAALIAGHAAPDIRVSPGTVL